MPTTMRRRLLLLRTCRPTSSFSGGNHLSCNTKQGQCVLPHRPLARITLGAFSQGRVEHSSRPWALPRVNIAAKSPHASARRASLPGFPASPPSRCPPSPRLCARRHPPPGHRFGVLASLLPIRVIRILVFIDAEAQAHTLTARIDADDPQRDLLPPIRRPWGAQCAPPRA